MKYAWLVLMQFGFGFSGYAQGLTDSKVSSVYDSKLNPSFEKGSDLLLSNRYQIGTLFNKLAKYSSDLGQQLEKEFNDLDIVTLDSLQAVNEGPSVFHFLVPTDDSEVELFSLKGSTLLVSRAILKNTNEMALRREAIVSLLLQKMGNAGDEEKKKNLTNFMKYVASINRNLRVEQIKFDYDFRVIQLGDLDRTAP